MTMEDRYRSLRRRLACTGTDNCANREQAVVAGGAFNTPRHSAGNAERASEVAHRQMLLGSYLKDTRASNLCLERQHF